REEHEQRDDVRQQVERERTGPHAGACRNDDARRDCAHAVNPLRNVRVSRRSRSAAMIELKTIASTPCADDVPTSFACEMVWYTKYGIVVVSVPGPPWVATKISPNSCRM